ncbi:MAG: hypothetical protein DI527_19975 [Chelatococcus sp.]|nr:MAG: hypothetical protein DI527_19975 [Chelatococcus sp.]
MTPAPGQSVTTGRERLRSRFRVGVLLLATASLLAGCGGRFGSGLAELPAERGWQPLPIGGWVLNDGLDAREMVFCPRASCAQPGFVALLAFEGERGRDMERALATDPSTLARLFAKPAAEAPKKPAKAPRKPGSTTAVSRFEADDARGLLVEIRAKDTGKSATTAILYRREDDKLILALAIAGEAASARRDAEAAWRSR